MINIHFHGEFQIGFRDLSKHTGSPLFHLEFKKNDGSTVSFYFYSAADAELFRKSLDWSIREVLTPEKMVLWDDCGHCKGTGKVWTWHLASDFKDKPPVQGVCGKCSGMGRVGRPVGPVDKTEEESTRG